MARQEGSDVAARVVADQPAVLRRQPPPRELVCPPVRGRAPLVEESPRAKLSGEHANEAVDLGRRQSARIASQERSHWQPAAPSRERAVHLGQRLVREGSRVPVAREAARREGLVEPGAGGAGGEPGGEQGAAGPRARHWNCCR
jgi:hypothetical protein